MEIKVNDYYEPDHFRALSEDNYNVSHSCEYTKNEMHHIHASCEILFAETGVADYYISGRKYRLERGDILVIGGMEHHQRRIEGLPFLRYGLSIKPAYYEGLNLGEDLKQVFQTPDPQEFELHCKHIDQKIFENCVELLKALYEEQMVHRPFRSLLDRTIMTQLAILLFRAFEMKRGDNELSDMNVRMIRIKEYIDTHFNENLNLQVLSEAFYLHPATISKEFNRYFGKTLNKYINNVRVCEAAKLLETTDESVTDIAVNCGYESVNTFLRQFKSVMETSPLQYRKSVLEWFERKPVTLQGLLES